MFRSTMVVLALLPLAAAGTADDPDITDAAGDAGAGLDIAAGWITLSPQGDVEYNIRLTDSFPETHECDLSSLAERGTYHYVAFYARPVDARGADTASWQNGAHIGADVRTECFGPGTVGWEFYWFLGDDRGGVHYAFNETPANGRIEDGSVVIEVPLEAFGAQEGFTLKQLYMRSFSGRAGATGSYDEDLAPDTGHGRDVEMERDSNGTLQVALQMEHGAQDAPAEPAPSETPWPLWASAVALAALVQARRRLER